MAYESEDRKESANEMSKAVTRLVGFAGSLRAGSYNRAALLTAAEHAPPEIEITPIEVRDVPMFDGDVEKAGDPSSVKRLKDQVRAADGLLIFTPEYNGSVSAVTKNAIDWLSRKSGDSMSPLTDRPVGIIAASPGSRGAPEAREHMLHVVGFMTKRLFGETLGISGVNGKVDDGGRLSDRATIDQLIGWLRRFDDHVRQSATTGLAV